MGGAAMKFTDREVQDILDAISVSVHEGQLSEESALALDEKVERLKGGVEVSLRQIAAMECRTQSGRMNEGNTLCIDRGEVHPQWWCHSCQARAALAEDGDRRDVYDQWIESC